MPVAVTAYKANPGFPLNLGVHVFSATADGQLLHEIDGNVRAIVPPEGWKEYVKANPEAASVVAGLVKPTKVAAPVAKAKKRR